MKNARYQSIREDFLVALRFLTILPAGKSTSDKERLPQAMIFFPLIGFFLGLILVSANSLFSFIHLDKLATCVILVTFLIILTGGLHLDGLADTTDALLSGKSRAQMLKIMRESQIGTMGSLSLICVILLKLSFLCALPWKVINVALITMCLVSRYSLVLVIFLFPYVREQGKAKALSEGVNRRILLSASGITLFCVLLFLGLKGLVALMLVVPFAYVLGESISKRIGGITGDTLGAINELTEVFALFIILILTRVSL